MWHGAGAASRRRGRRVPDATRLERLTLRVEQYVPAGSAEPSVSVRIALVATGESDWRGSAFLLRTAQTPDGLAWAVRQATRSALQQLGLL